MEVGELNKLPKLEIWIWSFNIFGVCLLLFIHRSIMVFIFNILNTTNVMKKKVV